MRIKELEKRHKYPRTSVMMTSDFSQTLHFRYVSYLSRGRIFSLAKTRRKADSLGVVRVPG